MSDSRFEQLILAIGGAAILGSLALAYSQGIPPAAEIVAHLMVFLVLVAAVRGGRRGGLLAAIVATTLYVFMRLPLLDLPVRPQALMIVGSRIAAFGLVGIVGGELSGRMRYLFAGMERVAAIDDWSHVYNQAHAHASVARALGKFDRYSEEFSVVLVSLTGSLFAGMRPARQRSMVRAAADLIRNDVRLVDEVARLDDGRFLVLLPHTPRAGALVVGGRLHPALAHALGARAEAISVQVLGTPTDAQGIRALLEAIAPHTEDAQPSSGRYSDDASRTRKPAAASDASAAASSTLITSTAASPEGSTKQ